MTRLVISLAVGLALAACGDETAAPCEGACPIDQCVDGRCTDEADAIQVDMAPPTDAAPPPDAAPPDAAGPDAAPDAMPPDYGPLPGPVERERSLVWIDPVIVDDPSMVSLGRAMAAASDDGHGGVLFDHTMRRFGTTPYSLRPDMAVIVDEMADEMGPDPAAWDLDAAPFIVTAVHLRLDLAGPESCGELRVSFSTTHRSIQPLHLIFLFEMPPVAGQDDCYGLAIRLARLSELDDGAFVDAARALLDTHLVAERFLVLETAEFVTFPWEWRQWVRVPNPDDETVDVLPFVLENPPLFQTVDVEGINRAGAPERRAFLRWVADNAADIDARVAFVPEEFRGPIAIAPTAIPRTPLSLAGLDPAVDRLYPDLRRNLELVGCPVCHTADADFVQTTPERTFSHFYDKELDARAEFLDAWVRTGEKPPVPYGPLQPNPVLPD